MLFLQNSTSTFDNQPVRIDSRENDENGADESKNSIPEYEESDDLNKYPFIYQFFGLPIVVVGFKADLMPKHDAAAIWDAKDTQAQIRGAI